MTRQFPVLSEGDKGFPSRLKFHEYRHKETAGVYRICNQPHKVVHSFCGKLRKIAHDNTTASHELEKD